MVRLGKGSREAEGTDAKQRWQEKKANLGFLSKRRQGIHVVACCSNQTRVVSVPQIRSLVPQETINGALQISAQAEVSRVHDDWR